METPSPQEPEHVLPVTAVVNPSPRSNSPRENLAAVLLTPQQDRERDLPPRPAQSEPDLTVSQPRSHSSSEPLATMAANQPVLTRPPPPVVHDAHATNHGPVLDYGPRRMTSPNRMASITPTVYDSDASGGRYPSIARPRTVFAPQSPEGGFSRRQSTLLDGVPTLTANSAVLNPLRERTVAERLEPTLEVARRERDQHALKGRFQSIIINGAIGLQVVAGALTTGVAAATTGRATSIGVSLLGGLSTILASFLAKARGSGEPEHSQLRARELDTFIREVEAWTMDHGHLTGPEYNDRINMFRERFEQIIRTEGEASYGSISYQASVSPASTRDANPKANEKV